MKLILIAAVIVVLGLGAFFGVRFFSETENQSQNQGSVSGLADITEKPVDMDPQLRETNRPGTTESPSAPEPAAPPAEPVPSLAESDSFLRDRFATNGNAYISRLLTRDNILRDAVTGIDLIRRGKNPGRKWFFLQPEGDLMVEERDGKTYLSEANYARYKTMVDAIEQVDVALTVNAYRFLMPVLQDAYAELGNEDLGWEESLTATLDLMTALDLPQGEIEVIGNEGVYIFADEAMENLPPAQKALIRMGPEQAARVQAKLAEIRKQLNEP